MTDWDGLELPWKNELLLSIVGFLGIKHELLDEEGRNLFKLD